MSAWLNPAGGLRYHARALFGVRLWAPYRAALGRWLTDFDPGTEQAVLVGPSGAHCMPDAFLRRFTDITVLDPDPLAGFLLTRRLRKLGVRELRVDREDQLIRPLLDGTTGLAELLEARPKCCVVFCNVLGQTRFLLSAEDFTRFKVGFRARFLPLLEGRAWLSFHDRLSGALPARFAQPLVLPARLSDEEVLARLYSADNAGLGIGAAKSKASTELLDHQSDGFFPPQLPHAYLAWQIDAQRCHLIEGVASG